MNNKTVFFTHSTALCALFFLGEAVIVSPAGKANEYSVLAYAFALAAAFALLLLTSFLSERLLSVEANKAVLYIVYTLSAVYAAFCAVKTLSVFFCFVSDILLPALPKFLGVIIFLSAVAFFGLSRQENFLKFSLLAFLVCLIAMIFFFIANFSNYNWRNIFIFRLPEPELLYKSAKPYITSTLLPYVFLLPVYQLFVFKRKRLGAVASGLAFGGVLLGFCILSSFLLFGADLSARLDYPYASVVSTVTVGRLFTRMDGFSYFIYFASSITKINTCIFIIYSSLKEMNKKAGR